MIADHQLALSSTQPTSNIWSPIDMPSKSLTRPSDLSRAASSKSLTCLRGETSAENKSKVRLHCFDRDQAHVLRVARCKSSIPYSLSSCFTSMSCCEYKRTSFRLASGFQLEGYNPRIDCVDLYGPLLLSRADAETCCVHIPISRASWPRTACAA